MKDKNISDYLVLDILFEFMPILKRASNAKHDLERINPSQKVVYAKVTLFSLAGIIGSLVFPSWIFAVCYCASLLGIEYLLPKVINKKEDMPQEIEKGPIESLKDNEVGGTKARRPIINESFLNNHINQSLHLEKDSTKLLATKSEYLTLEYLKAVAPTVRRVGMPVEYSQEETVKNVQDVLAHLQNIYNIPPINISDKEWSILFDSLYSKYCEKDIEACYNSAMINWLSATIANLFMPNTGANSEEINIESFMSSIWFLDNDLEVQEMNQVISDIKSKCRKEKILQLLLPKHK